MASSNTPHIILPLHTLFHRLEVAGYSISPAQRLHIYRIVQQFGTDYLHQPEKLASLLCPIIATSEAEQIRFHEIFARYLEDIRPAIEETIRPKWYQKMPGWLWFVAALVIIGAISWAIWNNQPVKPPPLSAQFDAPPTLTLGDTLQVPNQTQVQDTTRVDFHWKLLDEATQDVEWEQKGKPHCALAYTQLANSEVKILRLIVRDKLDGRVDSLDRTIRILCPQAPRVSERIEAPSRGEPEERITFRIIGEVADSIHYYWEFDTDDRDTGQIITRRFPDPGVYQVQLTVEREGTPGICVTTRDHSITIGPELALLDHQALHKDQVERLLNFSIGTWLLLGLLGVFMIIYWVRWLAKKPEEAKEEEESITHEQRFAHADKAPYTIPFQAQDHLLRTDDGLYRLANRLRRRQKGLRRLLDVPKTVQATIEGGGFPNVFFRRSTTPPEYLFLIDEQSADSHQSRLFSFLVKFLEDKDVHLSVFKYNSEFNCFWNEAHPKGIGLEQLFRMYPQYNLLVMGNGHTLLDPFAEGDNALRPAYVDAFEHWPRRAMLTPVPVASWTHREASLYELFPLFPAQISSFQAAIEHFNQIYDDEEAVQMSFAQWEKKRQLDDRQPNINYRIWRKPETYKEYLKGRPDLYLWLSALAVYPQPTWEMTIAIGRALESKGVIVTFDNLLILSQVPWLHGETLPHKLRKALVDELDPESEQIARETVKHLLDAAAPAADGSHANLELQINLAIQSFVLDPQNKQNQEAIQYLLDEGLLSRKQIMELNQGLERNMKQQGLAAGDTGYIADVNSLQEQPEEAAEAPPKPKRAFNADFYRALIASLFFLLLALLVWRCDGTPELYKAVTGEEPATSKDLSGEDLRNYFFVKENYLIDSAIIYNNQGVELWQQALATEAEAHIPEAETAAGLFAKAMAARALPYELGAQNRSKAQFNYGLEVYHDYLQRPFGTSVLSNVLTAFHEAKGLDSIRADAWHGLGLAHYMLYQADGDTLSLDSARHYLDLLEVENYFVNYPREPNLQTMLNAQPELEANCKGPEARFNLETRGEICTGQTLTINNRTIDRIRPVEFYLVNWGDGQQDSVGSFFQLSHTYPDRGCTEIDRTITLSAAFRCPDGTLSYSQAREQVRQLPQPVAAFAISTEQPCAGENIIFQNTASCATTYRWDFGDGTISTDNTATHQYESPGIYRVQLTAGNACSQRTFSQTITVKDCGTPTEQRPPLTAAEQYLATKESVVTRRYIAAGTGRVPDQSVLTKGLLEALRSRGGSDSLLTLDEIISYLNNETPRPVTGTFGQDEAGSDFVLPYGDNLSGKSRHEALFIANYRYSEFVDLSNPFLDAQSIGDVLQDDYDFYVDYGENYNKATIINVLNRYARRAYADDEWLIIYFNGQGRNGYFIPSDARVVDEDGATWLDYATLREMIDKIPCKHILVILDTAYGASFGTTTGNDGNKEIIGPEGIVLQAPPGEWICVKGDCNNGYGVAEYEDGTQYRGNFKNGKLHGIGRWRYRDVPTFKDDVEVYGRWENGEYIGKLEVPRPQMVSVEGGTFEMGSEDIEDAQPVHSVTLDSYEIGAHEVTFEAYDLFCEATGREKPGDEGWGRGGRPVINVNWYDAIEYCNWLSEAHGYWPVYGIDKNQKDPNDQSIGDELKWVITIYGDANGYRLPTEAEWEYAARGGVNSQGYIYSGSNFLDAVGWYLGSSDLQTHTVRQKAANELGLYDMSGNVYEWCWDWYSDSYYQQKGNDRNPLGPTSGRTRVVRGGSWDSNRINCRVLYRNDRDDFYRSLSIGFRLARY